MKEAGANLHVNLVERSSTRSRCKIIRELRARARIRKILFRETHYGNIDRASRRRMYRTRRKNLQSSKAAISAENNSHCFQSIYILLTLSIQELGQEDVYTNLL